MTISIFSLFAGMLLGQRFKLLVLVPALAFGLVATVTIGLARDAGLPSIALTSMGMVVALQVGYLLGSAIRLRVGRSAHDYRDSQASSAAVHRTAH